MHLIQKNTNPQYYVESVEELDDIPVNAPSGTVAIMNDSDGLKVYMKTDSGSWNQL